MTESPGCHWCRISKAVPRTHKHISSRAIKKFLRTLYLGCARNFGSFQPERRLNIGEQVEYWSPAAATESRRARRIYPRVQIILAALFAVIGARRALFANMHRCVWEQSVIYAVLEFHKEINTPLRKTFSTKAEMMCLHNKMEMSTSQRERLFHRSAYLNEWN